MLYLCVTLTVLMYSLVQSQGPILDTTYGKLMGATKTDNQGRTYEEYLGIPYADPPIGDLRWEKPSPPEPWGDEILEVTEFSTSCTQPGLYNTTSEDCLYLNIYVPGTNRSGDNLSVMFWIHGGAFLWGSGGLYPGNDLALLGDVIVVTFNYRLSTLGWLSTEDDVIPGNYGLWDGQLALSWVVQNIAAFGGNPDSITVFGQSAGGALTSHFMISQTTNEMFKAGIPISGASSGFVGTALSGSAALSTRTLARLAGCGFLNITSTEIKECLQYMDAEELDTLGLVAVVGVRRILPNWMPVVDGDFIPVHPTDSWPNAAATSLGLMTGCTYHDAAGFILTNIYGEPNVTFNFAGTQELLNTSLAFVTNHYPGDSYNRTRVILDEYTLMEDEDEEVRTAATVEAMTDWWFETWAHYEASQHSKTSGTGTYLYNFRYDQSFLQYRYDWIEGSHGDDSYSIFGYPYNEEFRQDILGKDFTEVDFLVQQYMMSYMVNFANNGDPNIGLSVPVEWSRFDRFERNYLEISDSPEILQQTDEMLDTYRFWNKEFPMTAFPPDGPQVKEWDDIDLLSDEEFKEVVLQGIDDVKLWMSMMLSNQPERLASALETLYNVLERLGYMNS